MKIAIETYVYYHTQCPGYQVRKKFAHRGRMREVSKFFSVARMGSLRAARRRALWWKARNLS